jgi:hypothetical protein
MLLFYIYKALNFENIKIIILLNLGYLKHFYKGGYNEKF